MRKTVYMIVAALGLAVAFALPARAQQFHLAGGVSIPDGRLNSEANTGWHLSGGVGFSPLTMPVGFRFDASYHRFAFEPVARASLGGGADRTVMSGTANAILRIPMTMTSIPWSPYVIGGVGLYRNDCASSLDCFEADTRLGWNLGLGTNMMLFGLNSFVEARWHSMGGWGEVFPLTVGVRFPN